MNDTQRARMKEALEAAAGRDSVLLDEPMKGHTTFRIGGPADFFVQPQSAEAVRRTLKLCAEEEIPFFVMGNGSNLLVADEGFRGVVVCIGRQMSRILREGTQIRAEAGAKLSAIASAAQEASLTGFEFAGGIPGTLGGACVMNAGAYDGEMKQVLRSVTCLAEDGEIRVIPAEKLELGYRTSIFMRKPMVALEAEIVLAEGDRAEIDALTAELREKRQSKQPLDLPSAGSTFKRPKDHFAGKLIMDAGLRGYRVGGAQVSEKHCGFVVNTGGATASDVRTLIGDVQKCVKERFGVTLQPEIRFIGFPL